MKTVVAIVLATVTLFTIPVKDSPKGHWENAETYVYYTEERAVYEGEEGGVAYFWVQDLGTFGAYIYDTDLVEGDVVNLTFENRETKAEYLEAEEYGIESVTRVDNGMIVAID